MYLKCIQINEGGFKCEKFVPDCDNNLQLLGLSDESCADGYNKIEDEDCGIYAKPGDNVDKYCPIRFASGTCSLCCAK